ncbi:hypothetical protein [Gloeocapsopsis dulcis]|uniref:hypothetical protein n=1 Tax=Gloeocapsopsis dulcis TaxID=2859516 RepID=UPI00101ADC0B|nr:hypothetical protein [Gloeocapsopsis dulcis]WNN87492.1 hypothetical protein P0S91_14270 [Gloeocapsopsis dulcis]
MAVETAATNAKPVFTGFSNARFRESTKVDFVCQAVTLVAKLQQMPHYLRLLLAFLLGRSQVVGTVLIHSA